MRYAAALFAVYLTLAGPALAQIQPDAATSRRVDEATAALFDLLPRADFAAEHALMSDELAAMASLSDWTDFRRALIAELGPTPRYAAHAVTYYQQARLLAAVDFWGKAARADTYVCGFVLWDILPAGDIRLGRIEQNIVPVTTMRQMAVQEAAQLMANWRCPKDLIGSVLGVTVQ